MIPKIVHYIWLGKTEMNDTLKKCMKSWEIYLKGYEFKLWNEDNIDLTNIPLYIKKEYKRGNYAYVSDYIRCKILYEYGGIYLDTDVEILKPFDELLEFPYVFSLERGPINDAIFLCEKHNKLLENVIKYYDNLNKFNHEHLGTVFHKIISKKYKLHICHTNKDFKYEDDTINSFINIKFNHENGYSKHHYQYSWKPFYNDNIPSQKRKYIM